MPGIRTHGLAVVRLQLKRNNNLCMMQICKSNAFSKDSNSIIKMWLQWITSLEDLSLGSQSYFSLLPSRQIKAKFSNNL